MERDYIRIRNLFDRLAPYYDGMNDALSLGFHRRWRRVAMRELHVQEHHHSLDLCCGTGMWTLALARAAPAGRVVGMDASRLMIERGCQRAHRLKVAHRIEWRVGDVHELPFAEHSFDHVTIGFGLRNVRDPAQVIHEMVRVLRPGGQLAILELHGKTGKQGSRVCCAPYLRFLPLLGEKLVGQRDAYAWLRNSMQTFPSSHELVAWLERITPLRSVCVHRWWGGLAAFFLGRKPI